MMIWRLSRWVWIAGVLSIPAVAEESPWELTSAASLALADGNTESEAWSLQVLATYFKDPYEASLGIDYFYSANDGVRSADRIQLHEQVSRSLAGPWYVSQYGSALQDQVAEIDHRVDASVLLGYRLLNTERARLSIEAGPGYAWEQKAGVSEDFATARLAQRFEYMFNEDVRMWQSFGWTPRLEDLSQGIIELDAGIEMRINAHFAMRTFLRHRIDQSPSTSSGKGDTALMVGLSYDHEGVKAPKPSQQVGRKTLLKVKSGGVASPDEGWDHTAAFGLTVNKGNADKMGTNVSWDSEYNSEERDFIGEIDYLFTDENDQTSADRLSSRAQYNRYLDGPAYLGAAAGFLRDDLADIAYRATPSLLAGYALIKNDTTKLALEAGPTLTVEETGGDRDQYASLRLAQRLKHRFNNRQVLRQSLVGMSEVGDAENYTLVAAISLDTELTGNWIWRVAGECQYENQPVIGRERRDLLLTSSVAVKF